MLKPKKSPSTSSQSLFGSKNPSFNSVPASPASVPASPSNSSASPAANAANATPPTTSTVTSVSSNSNNKDKNSKAEAKKDEMADANDLGFEVVEPDDDVDDQEDIIRIATEGMTEEEAKQFRVKMKEMRRVLEAELQEIQVQNTKLAERLSSVSDVGTLEPRPSLKRLKRQSTLNRDSKSVQGNVTTARKDVDSVELMMQLSTAKHEIEGLLFLKEQSQARLSLYEDTLSQHERLLMEKTAELAAAHGTIESLNHKVKDLETKLAKAQAQNTTGQPQQQQPGDDIAAAAKEEEWKRILAEKELQYRESLDRRDKEYLKMKEQAYKLETNLLEKTKQYNQLKTDHANTQMKLFESLQEIDQLRNLEIKDEPQMMPILSDPSLDSIVNLPPSKGIVEHFDSSSSLSSLEPEAAQLEPTKKRKDKSTKSSSKSSEKSSASKKKKNARFSLQVLLLDGSLDGDLSLVKKCVEDGVDINVANEEGLTPLHSSSCNGHADIVKYLLLNGADVNVVDDDMWTPLHGAACFGDVSVVKLLVEHGANIQTMNNDDDTPIDVAAEENTLRYLNQCVKNLEIKTELYGLYDFNEGDNKEDLFFSMNEKLTVLSSPEARREDLWWRAKNEKGQEGWVPSNYLGEFPRAGPPTPRKGKSSTDSNSSDKSSSKKKSTSTTTTSNK